LVGASRRPVIDLFVPGITAACIPKLLEWFDRSDVGMVPGPLQIASEMDMSESSELRSPGFGGDRDCSRAIERRDESSGRTVKRFHAGRGALDLFESNGLLTLVRQGVKSDGVP